jgi:hypothetical protein
MSETNNYPLVLVFYLDREMMSNNEIIGAFAESINHMINYKQMNAIALFMPTDGEERVECINPVVVPKADMDRISKIIDEISKTFSIGEKLDTISDGDIILDDNTDK